MLPRILIAVTLGMTIEQAAWSQVNKCVGTDGKVSYSDQACPTAPKPAGKVAKLREPDEVACAMNWLINKETYEALFGIGVDRVIMNGKEIHSSLPEARAMVQKLDPVFAKCASAGIAKPTVRDDLATNLWHSVQKLCKPISAQIAAEAAAQVQSPGQQNIDRNRVSQAIMSLHATECKDFAKNTPSLDAAKADYRNRAARAAEAASKATSKPRPTEIYTSSPGEKPASSKFCFRSDPSQTCN